MESRLIGYEFQVNDGFQRSYPHPRCDVYSVDSTHCDDSVVSRIATGVRHCATFMHFGGPEKGRFLFISN